MRAVRSVRWWFWGLLLTIPPLVQPATAQADPVPPASDPVFIRLPTGTWAIGGIDDLTHHGRSLTLMPATCHEHIAIVNAGIGFLIDEEFTELDVAGSVRASDILDIAILFRNPATGKCDFFRLVDGRDASFLLQGLPVDSEIYRNGRTSEVELCLRVRRACGPPPTDEDAVSVQDLTIGPKGGGL